jgi:6-phosphofructokinase 1
LGKPTIPSPLNRSKIVGDGLTDFVPDDMLVQHEVCFREGQLPNELVFFEKAGAREKIFFDPAKTKVAIVTCGGLCPGLNNVIHSIFLELHFLYGVHDIVGIRYGYEGLNPEIGLPPIQLTLDMVDRIHEDGGTMLGASRGQQDPNKMADFMLEQGINIVFCIGGDGTQRGAYSLFETTRQRKLDIAVVGVPKTIDNDIGYCEQSFGYMTAIDEAERVLRGAHMEARGARNGIGLVKVMGRDAGFIAAGAAVASQEVNFALIPEIPFALEGENGFLNVLRQRIERRGHALIVVAEGAGQELFQEHRNQRDASGNLLYNDIGLLLKDRIKQHFAEAKVPISLKYIDPSYTIRSAPANCEDRILCNQFARRAVHAAMAGKTGMVIGYWNDEFINVPIAMVTSVQRRVEPEGALWTLVQSSTGQPNRFF